MKYSIYQISLTSEQIALINKTDSYESVPAMSLKMKMQFDLRGEKIADYATQAFDARYYTCVANIEADDLDSVYEIGNIGPESKIERINPMSSISIGDIIADECGDSYVVSGMGFKSLGVNELLAA